MPDAGQWTSSLDARLARLAILSCSAAPQADFPAARPVHHHNLYVECGVSAVRGDNVNFDLSFRLRRTWDCATVSMSLILLPTTAMASLRLARAVSYLAGLASSFPLVSQILPSAEPDRVPGPQPGGDEPKDHHPVPFRRVQVAYPAAQELLIFDLRIDDRLRRRFHDIWDRLQKPLQDYIKEKCPSEPHGVISARLFTVGTTQDAANPSILVFCDKRKAKAIGAFFRTPIARGQRQSEDGLPAIEVYIVPHPPQPKLRRLQAEIHIPQSDESSGTRGESSCGRPIRFSRGASEDHLHGTLGGLIMATKWDNTTALYGMTAGHLLESWTNGADTRSLGQDTGSHVSDSDDSDTEASSSADPSKIGSWKADRYPRIDTVYMPEITESHPHYYDWALFGVREPRRNLFPGRADINSLGDLIMPRSNELAEPRQVAMLCASRAPRFGSLSDGPSRLLLGPGRSLVNTLILSLDDNESTYAPFHAVHIHMATGLG